MIRHGNTGAARPRCGFTLLELVVTISVIVFLVGMTLTAGSALVQKSEIRRTESTLRLLDMAVEEWELRADRKITQGPHQTAGGPFDLDAGTPFVFIITELLERIRSVARVETIVSEIEPDFVYVYREAVLPPWPLSPQEADVLPEFVDGLTILDAWGRPIYATHPGERAEPGTPPASIDADGTFHTYNERSYGAALRRRICFVSAGPDGEFGNMASGETTDGYKLTLDNVFSYPIER